MKKVSIIIPCFNAERYISKCLDSLLVQSYRKFEVICINDGSSDNTLSILKNYSGNDKRIMVVSQKNEGLSAARNTGIEKTSGEFIMFVDADDFLEDDALAKALSGSCHDLVCFSYNRIYGNKKKPRDLGINGPYTAEIIQRRMVGLLDEELNDPSQADSLVTAWGKLYRRDIIKKNNLKFIDTDIIGTEDALFNIEYLEWAENVWVINEPLYNYLKINNNSLTQTYKSNLPFQWKTLYAKIAVIIRHKSSDYSSALDNRICLGLIGLGLNETFSVYSFYAKYNNLKDILSDEMYVTALKNLNMQYFSPQWKVFFYFAKRQSVFMLLLMLMYMKSKLK